MSWGVLVCCSKAGFPAGGQAPRGGAVGHPFAAQRWRHGALRQKVRGGRDQSKGSITPSWLGDHDCHDLRPPRSLAGSRCSGSSGQTTDVMVAQAVEHQPGQLAGGGDHTDVAATTLPDPVSVLPEQGMTGYALHGLDRGPAHQPAALFICGIGVVKSRGTNRAAACSWSSPVAVGRVGAGPGSRLGRQPDRVAAAGPGCRRRSGASSPGSEKIGWRVSGYS